MAASDNGPRDSVRLSPANAKYSVRQVVAVEPKGWRDAWAVLRGRYNAQVRITTRLTSAGTNRLLKKTWSGASIRKQLAQESPLWRALR